MASGLRTIPDALERKGLPIEWLQKVQDAIDDGLQTVADRLKAICEEAQRKLGGMVENS